MTDQPDDISELRQDVDRIDNAIIELLAERRTVRLGEASGVRFEVLSGLAAGDIVVVRGNERLRPGQAVTYKGMKRPEGAEVAPGAGKDAKPASGDG